MDHFNNAMTIESNRQRFIEEHDAIRLDKTLNVLSDFVFQGMNGEFSKFFDHTEYFKTKTGCYILITSPYGDVLNDAKLDEFKTILGFEQTHQMYNDWAITFMKVIPDVKEFRKDMKRWSGKRYDSFSFRS